MENSQASLQEHKEARNVPNKRYNGHVCTISVSFDVPASSFPLLREDLVQFSQQLSTFPTCTESAAILVFAFESNPAEGERREVQLQKQALL